ncbi:hypothetical protein V6N11_059147 [Hibiscus sabdariffa]|uniref:Uncharacterized protein n=1 Tax=Hibiscus sabdariffa TaxID=183260 RepID=A0ABR2U6J2_9ROSI
MKDYIKEWRIPLPFIQRCKSNGIVIGENLSARDSWSSIAGIPFFSLESLVGYVDVGASTSASRPVALKQPHADSFVAKLGPDFVQNMQIVDSLEQGAEPDFYASGHVHFEQVLCSELGHDTALVGQAQSMFDCAPVTQPHVDQVQPIVNPLDQATVLDCSNQLSALPESDSRLVREASKGIVGVFFLSGS